MPTQSRITPDRIVLVGVFLAAIAYLQDIRYDFILDDIPLILMDETIASWRNWKTLFVNPISPPVSSMFPVEFMTVHYRPVYRLWQMLNAQLFGSVLPWWHLTSILLHIAATILVYQLGIKLLKEPWTAALAALLFAFHPIHVESVAYVTASTDLLVTIFSLIAFLAYFRFREEGASPIYFLGSVLAAAMAMLSKETAGMIPWMLVAYEALRPSISGVPSGAWQRWKQFFWTLPFFAVVGAYVAVRTLLFGVNTGPGPGGSRWAALLDIPLVLILYLHNLFWPFRLSFFYPVEWGSEWTVLKAAAIVLAMVTAIYLWIQYQDRSGVRLQLLWAAILFVPPVLGVYAFERAAWGQDRQVYLVSVPICLIVAALLTDRRLPTKASILVSALVLAILLVDTVFQVPRFSDNAAIYASALKVAPRNTLAHGYYAEALWSYGRYEQGLREFKIVTDLLPKSPGAYERYGAALAQTGQDDEAMAEYAKALHWSTSPTALRAVVLSEMTGIELKRSEFQEAADHAREAIQIAPQTLNYHSLLAQALSRQGHTREADEEMRIEAGIRQRYVQEQRASKN